MEERSLAKCEDFDFIIDDHGLPLLNGTFNYENGSAQGLGFIIDVSFLMRLMEAVGVGSLQDINKKSCWVTHTHSEIFKIEPLHKKDGTTFNIKKWRDWYSTNPDRICPYREEDQKESSTHH